MPTSDYDRIGKAIRFLREQAVEQPSLEETARRIGLSPAHFQRLFKRWTGVSPKRFLQFLTAEHAKELLHASATVLDTTYEVGLSSQGRLHDLFVSVEAVTPGQFKSRGEGLTLRYGLAKTPFGTGFAALSDRGLVTLGFTDGDDRARAKAELAHDWRGAKLTEDRKAVARVLDRVFAGGAHEEELRLHLTGTNLQIKVWHALLSIPEGRVVSYGELARAVGKPRAVRAVGSAVGRNPISYLIPCHRVLRATGALGGYRWGLARKQAMLAREWAGRPRATDAGGAPPAPSRRPSGR